MFSDNGMKSFSDIKQEFNLDQKEYWKFLQLSYCIRGKLKSAPDLPSGFQEVFMKPGFKKPLFSTILSERREPPN